MTKPRHLIMLAFAGILLMNARELPAQDTLRFAFVTDLHFGKTTYEGTGELLYPDKWMKQALYGILQTRAEFIMLGGDLIESSNSAAQYDLFDAAMKTELPWYPMPGNHDIGAESTSVTMAKIDAWIARGYGRGPSNREFYGLGFGDLAAIYVLNTQAFIASDPAVQARAEEELAELDTFFTAHTSAAQKIVCSHVPLFISSLSDPPDYFTIAPGFRSRIVDLMNKHGAKYYVAGHRHVNGHAVSGGITVMFNTALSFQLGSGNERGYYLYTVTSDSVQQEFHPLIPAGSFEIKTNTQGHGSVMLEPDLPYYASGSTVRLIAQPDPEWKFERWQGDFSGTQQIDSLVVNAGKTITAVFVEEHPSYPFSVRVEGAGSVTCTPPATGGVILDSMFVTLEAHAAEGWNFAGWTGGLGGSKNPDTILVVRAEEIKALFHKAGGQVWLLPAVQDSYVRGSLYSGNNFGTDTTLRVLEGGSDLSRYRTYLQFDLTSLRTSPGTILGAQLKLTVGDAGLTLANTGASIYACTAGSDAWTETGITWKTAPTEGALADSVVSMNHGGALYSWNLTGAVTGELAGDGMLSVLLKDKAARNKTVLLASRESVNPPVLEVEMAELGPDAVDGRTIERPTGFRLEQNYPNPFNPSTDIRYSLAEAGPVHLAVYDMVGREVRLILDSFRNGGTFTLRWDGRDNAGRILPSGCYMLRMKTSNMSQQIKMMLVK